MERTRTNLLHSVHIGRLARDISKVELLDLFKGYESIKDCFLKNPEQGKEFTWAFIRFERKEEADRAIENLNGWPVHGSRITVAHSRDSPRKPKGVSDRSSRPGTLNHHDRKKMNTLKDTLISWDDERSDGSKDPMDILERVAELSARLVPPYSDNKFGYKPIDLEVLYVDEDKY